MLSRMALSTTGVFSEVLLRRTVSSGHRYVTFITNKTACISNAYVYLGDANQISQKGISLMSIIHNGDQPSLLNILNN